MQEMLKPPECHGCPLEYKSIAFSTPESEGTTNIYIVGDALDEFSVRDGHPFTKSSAAGSKLEECFRLAEGELLTPVRRSMFTFWNMVACQPPYNLLADMPWERGSIEHCRVHFDRVIHRDRTSENVILALGQIPLKYLTDANGSAKDKQSLFHLRGYVFKSKYGLVIPSLPADYIKRGNPSLTPLLVEDIKKAIRVVKGEYIHRYSKEYAKPKYIEYAGLDQANSFANQVSDNANRVLAYDIETEDSAGTEEDEREELDGFEITQIQFSLAKGTGIAIPFKREYYPTIAKILRSRNTKAGFNSYNFDNPRIKAKGFSIEGKIHDVMWMFKHFQPNLPRGLQSVSSHVDFPFPWKHLFSSKFGFYGCADVDSLHWILAQLPKWMKETGVWKGYYEQVFGMWPVLNRASELGLPVNDTARLELRDTLVSEAKVIDDGLQEIIPNAIKSITPKRKGKNGNISFGYIREPREVKAIRTAYESVAARMVSEGRRINRSFSDIVHSKLGLEFRKFTEIDKQSGEPTEIHRWCRVEPFNARSSDQVIRYIKWKGKQLTNSKVKEDQVLSKKYVVPQSLKVNKKTGERSTKDSTGKKELEELFLETGDSVLEQVTSYRSTMKVVTNDIPNWGPKKDGAVHTTWGMTAASGQLDSRAPNILNCSKHTGNGQRFRRIIEAPKGWIFVEADKKSFHVATMGYLANSKNYIRFSQIDPHSIFTSYIMPSDWGRPIDFSWSDADIISRCKEIKQLSKQAGNREYGIDIRQTVAKPCVLGNQLGLGPRKLWMTNRRSIQGVKHAMELQARLNEVFSEVARTKDRVREEADKLKKLYLAAWGYVQYFYEVFTWHYIGKIGQYKRGPGIDSEKCIAFPVQGNAFGMLKWHMLECESKGYLEEYGFCNTIHDSVMFLMRQEQFNGWCEYVLPIFRKPCDRLVNEATGPKGLCVDVEVSMGRNWQSYDKDKNPEGMQDVKV